MKSHYISLLSAALLWGTAWAGNDNSFYFTDAAVLPGGQTDIELCMAGSAAGLTCLEAEIRLPEGLSLVCDEEGNPVATLYRNRTTAHELLANVLASGNLKLLVSDIDGHPFSGEEGPVLSFRVQAAETTPKGECHVETVGESLLVNTEAEATYSVGITGNVLITDNATGTAGPEEAESGIEAPVFSLSGQRLPKVQNGINIVGKKKISVFRK